MKNTVARTDYFITTAQCDNSFNEIHKKRQKLRQRIHLKTFENATLNNKNKNNNLSSFYSF